ncbi:replication restart DNA helicase PriA [Eubacterium ruminantium]|nr:replication restart DNA helicase PriA [Eubacterium ruminantium]
MLHSFTRNHNDLSTEAGFQFEFFCDCCGNGFKSTFIESSTYVKKKKTERFGGFSSMLGGLMGGNRLGDIGHSLERGSSIMGDRLNDQSPAWRREQEAAFDSAQEEVRPMFRKCPACNKWVCQDCWNDEDGLCTDCAPREASYVAQARSRAMQRNIDEAAETAVVWQGKIENRTTVCPRCGKPAGSGKFCNECGAPLGTNRCPNCGAEVALGLKFCGECGTPMQKTGKCPSCGFENEPGTKFCGQCGTKL